MKKIKVKDFMVYPVTTVTADTPIYEAIQILLENNISGAPVIEEQSNRIIGIITEKDLLNIMSKTIFHDQLPASCRVENYMTTNITTIKPDNDIFQILDLFLRTVYRRFPVVDHEHKLLGLVSRCDALAVCQKIWDNHNGQNSA